MSIDEVTTLLVHETRIAHKKTLASYVASINLTKGAKPNFTPNFSLNSAQEASGSSGSSNLQAYVAHSNSVSGYRNYNGGNHYINTSAGRGGGCWNFSHGGRNGGHGGGRYANIQCQICHKYGHEATYCYQRHNDDYVLTRRMEYPDQNQSQTSANPNQYQSQNLNSNNYQNQRLPQANLTSVALTSSSYWYPDSGAYHHVTNVSQNIHQTTPFEGPDQITIGNGQGLNINSSGLTSFVSPFNPKIPLVLNNLLFVPSITKNIISVSQFCRDNSVFFEFHSDLCLVKSQVSKEVLLKGMIGCDGLYQFPDLLQSTRQQFKPSFTVNTISSASSEPVPSASASDSATCVDRICPSVSHVNTASSSTISFATWHSRLGHPNVDTMKVVFKLCNIPFYQ